MTTRAALQTELAGRLGSAAEARWMVEEVLGPRGLPSAPVSDGDEAELSRMASRRGAGEPLQYVLGSWAFRTLELMVDPRALIPRPETEQVVEVAIAEARRPAVGALAGSGAGPVIADLGTGTGAIALAMAVELAPDHPGLEVWATDADAAALALARANLDRVGARHPGAAACLRLRLGSWFEALPPWRSGGVGVVVANPPYVSEEEWAGLDPEVRREPRQALVAGPDRGGTPGMGAVEAVLVGAVDWLAPGGSVVVELAPHQAGPASALARRLGYAHVRVERDLAGLDRAVVGRR
jgi:release factor glutamine methyltransferase